MYLCSKLNSNYDNKFKKFPNRFKDEKVASIIHLTRNIFASHEIDELYKTKRSENIRVVK